MDKLQVSTETIGHSCYEKLLGLKMNLELSQQEFVKGLVINTEDLITLSTRLTRGGAAGRRCVVR